jgi:hypothetical protein
MQDYFGKIGDLFADLSSTVVIGSLAIALALALIVSAVHVLMRGKKGRDPFAPLCGLMFAVSLVSMVVAAAHVRPSPRDALARPGGTGWPRPSFTSGRAILNSADTDRDGHLTPREAVGLVRRADMNRKGYADLFDLDHLPWSGPPGTAIAERRDDPPCMPPGPGHPESVPMMEACFPTTGGATGHETWPMISRHWGPTRPPRL